MTAPIRRIIDEEVAVLISTLYKENLFTDLTKATPKLREFVDALEHVIDKYHLKEVQSAVDREVKSYQDELTKKEQELTETKAQYEGIVRDLQARNKRLHDEIKRLQKKVRELEKNSLTARLNESISDVLTNELVKHLKDEITFLRTLLLRR